MTVDVIRAIGSYIVIPICMAGVGAYGLYLIYKMVVSTE